MGTPAWRGQGWYEARVDAVICMDDQRLAASLERALVRAGHQVSGLFTHAFDGVARCQHLRPDLVVVSAVMTARADGGALVRTARRLSIPVVIINAQEESAGAMELYNKIHLV